MQKLFADSAPILPRPNNPSRPRPASRTPDSQSVTSLLNRAGFSLSTVDVDEIQIAYPSIFELIDDLKWMGEGNAVVNRRKRLDPETLLAAGEIYKGALRGFHLRWYCERTGSPTQVVVSESGVAHAVTSILPRSAARP